MKRRKSALEKSSDPKRVLRTPAENISKHFNSVDYTQSQDRDNNTERNTKGEEKTKLSQSQQRYVSSSVVSTLSESVSHPQFQKAIHSHSKFTQPAKSCSVNLNKKPLRTVWKNGSPKSASGNIRSRNVNRSQLAGTRESEIDGRLSDMKSRLNSIRKSTQTINSKII